MIRSGFSPWNTCLKPSPSAPTSASGPTRTPSKCSVNCRSGSSRSTGNRWASRPAASGWHDEQRKLGAALVLPGPGDDQEGFGLVHPGDVVLGAVQHPVPAVADGGGGDAKGVGARVRLGDREHDLDGAAGQAGQPRLALLFGAEFGDHLGRDRRGDEQQQQRHPGGGDLLADEREFGQPSRRHRRSLPGCSRRGTRPGPGPATVPCRAGVRRPARRNSAARTWRLSRLPPPAAPGVLLIQQSPRQPFPDCDSSFTSDLSAWMRDWLDDGAGNIGPELGHRRGEHRSGRRGGGAIRTARNGSWWPPPRSAPSAASTLSRWRTSAPRPGSSVGHLPSLRQQDRDPGGDGRPGHGPADDPRGGDRRVGPRTSGRACRCWSGTTSRWH